MKEHRAGLWTIWGEASSCSKGMRSSLLDKYSLSKKCWWVVRLKSCDTLRTRKSKNIYIYINNRYNIFQWSIYRCCNKHSYRVNSKHVQNFHIKNAIGQTGQTSVKLLLATWVILAQPWNNNFWNPFAVCGIWCLSHNHTLILISSWIRYYYILTNFVYASLLNQLETSDTHTSAYHHRRQQGLGSTFPSEGKDK